MTSIENMIAVVQCYIHMRKDKQVQINTNQFQDHFNVIKLVNAYNIANEWFISNNAQIKTL